MLLGALAAAAGAREGASPLVPLSRRGRWAYGSTLAARAVSMLASWALSYSSYPLGNSPHSPVSPCLPRPHSAKRCVHASQLNVSRNIMYRCGTLHMHGPRPPASGNSIDRHCAVHGTVHTSG